MLFPTVAFALFFCFAFLANWLLRPRPTPWRLSMVALSLYFYGFWDRRFVLLLLLSIGLNYAVGKAVFSRRVDGVPTRRGRHILRAGIAANLGILGFFKYYGFFTTSASNSLGRLGIEVSPPVLDLTLPIGISFFTFQAISYIVDVGRDRFERPLPLLDCAFFLSFFPQLVAGPIVRASDMAQQIARRPDPRAIPAGEAFWLIGQGLFKKVIVSSYLASELVDPVFAVPGDYSRGAVLLAVYGYAIQIYADFSGYTDIAIGCALLLGFRFPQNFDAPYRATSVQDFWRRWHISLSTWLRDYLYIPLGGNRRGRLMTLRNLAITMVLGGLWHGAAWTFVVWGAIHAVALSVERLATAYWQPLGFGPAVVSTMRWLTTFHVICLSWVFFRAESFGQAFALLGRLGAGGESIPLVSGGLLVLVGVVLAAQFVPSAAPEVLRSRFGLSGPGFQIIALVLVLTAIDTFGPDGVAPFIYFQF